MLSQSVVLTAKQFQPEMVGEYFLIENKIVVPGGIYGPKVATEQFSNASTANFDLLVLQEKSTFNIKSTALVEEVLTSIERFVNAIPEPRYTAMGMNFAYQINDGKSGSLAEWASTRFKPQSKFDRLEGVDALWGSIVFKSYSGAKMRLQVVPGFNGDDMSQPPVNMVADFNYHFKLDSTPKAKDELIQNLKRFEEFSSHSCEIYAQLSK